MRVVIALGGNALLRRGDPLSEDVQLRNVKAAAKVVAALAHQYQVVVTHGNGPQIGLLALESEAYKDVAPYSLDALGAESQGMIGFFLEQAFRNALPETTVATILTSVLVDAADPAFGRPTKPMGPVYDEATARQLAASRGWNVAPDGDRFRRVVPSPEPIRILEIGAIRLLVDAGVLVICAGGGGVPVVRAKEGDLAGVEGVVDKDLTSALLAEALGADWLLMLTDVAAVHTAWGTPEARPIREATPAELHRLTFDPGSMGPKVEAACRFVERTSKTASIGSMTDACDMLERRAGTTVHP